MGGKTSNASIYKYQKRAYDRIAINVKSGDKDRLQDHAATQGQSLNAWIRGAINQRLETEGGVQIGQLDSAPGGSAAAGDGDTTI